MSSIKARDAGREQRISSLVAAPDGAKRSDGNGSVFQVSGRATARLHRDASWHLRYPWRAERLGQAQGDSGSRPRMV